MKLNQFDGILAFVTVAQQRSFTAAAAKLEVTPPAISQSVRQLEEKLGVRLLNRTTRSVGLTEAGQRFLERIAPVLEQLAQAGEDLDNFRDGPTGLLRLNMPHIAWDLYMSDITTAFLKLHPGVQIEIQLEDGFVDVVKEGFDAGVRLGESVQQDMVAVPFTPPAKICLVASPDYLQRHGTPQTIEDLRQHACIRYRFRSSKSIYRWELLRDGQIIDVEVTGALTLTDSRGMRDAVLAGAGIGYLFEKQVVVEIESGRLIGVLRSNWPTFGSFCLYYPNRQQMPAKLRAFVDYCKSVLNQSL